MYNAYYNDMFNMSYIQQQAQLQYHQNQTAQIAECVHKWKDFLDSADKIAPEYQLATMAALCAAFFDHNNRNTLMG